MSTVRTPGCRRRHGDTLFGFTIGAAIVMAVGLGILVSNGLGCGDFQEYGYHVVPSNNRAAVVLEEFRRKVQYKPAVRLYATPFRQAYTSDDSCHGQFIVLPLQDINFLADESLRALIGHELGHRLAARHANPTDGSSDRGQQEADGYGIELAGEADFRAYWRTHGYNEAGIQKNIDAARAALADLRKRAPLP